MFAEPDETEAVLEEHRRVLEVVQRVDDWLETAVARDEQWGKELGRRVGSVIEQLKIHFGGDVERHLFEDLAHTAPHLTGKLTALAREHEQILGDFQVLAEQALAAEVTDAVANRLAVLSRRAMSRLRRHEAEENEIVLRAVWEDLGTGD